MGSFYNKFTYRQLLTIKDALFYYITRDGATEEDWNSETALLSKVKGKIKSAEEKKSK